MLAARSGLEQIGHGASSWSFSWNTVRTPQQERRRQARREQPTSGHARRADELGLLCAGPQPLTKNHHVNHHMW